tara:strand:+ start:102 stop:275 length:174 start_codon:yes stop_codon:yes gene_type:complete
MASKDWDFKSWVAHHYKTYANLWDRGFDVAAGKKEPKTKKGKLGFYNRLTKELRKEW